MKTSMIKALSALVIVGVLVIPAFTSAQVPSTDGGDTGGADAASASPSTDGGNTGGGDSNSNPASTPSTDGSNIGGGDSNENSSAVPSTDGGNTGGGDSNLNSNPVPSTDGGNTGGGDSAPSTPGNNGGDNNGGTGGGSSSRSSRSSASSTTPVVLGGSCSYLSSYLKMEGTNSASEVTKLQSFLKNIEKLDVDINGKFDAKTFEAVKAFQAKHVADIMGPWGVSTPTGQVYFTTLKKINEVYCNAKLTLTPAQLAEIEAYRKGIVAGTIAPEGTASTTAPVVPSIGSTETGSSQTAAAAETSFGGKIWNFIKWLFGY